MQPIRNLGSMRGFTLVELMIALVIGLLMSFGLIRVFASSSESYHALSQASQQIENGRYAVQAISDDLRLAGFYGEWGEAPPAAGGLPNPCETANMVALSDALSFYVQGYNDADGSEVACLGDANVVDGTDILVIRRANTEVTPTASLAANDVYIQANPIETPIVALGTAANFTLTKLDPALLADIRKYRVIIYYVSPCSEPVGGNVCNGAADGGRPTPTLKRLTLALDTAGALTMRNEPIAEGIENLQIDYGVDTTNDGVADGAFVAAPAAWSDVMAARIHVLARTPETTPGVADTKTYNLGTAGPITPGGSFRRHLFTAQVRLVNPSARREEP